MNSALIVILAAVMLDAVGIGLIFPILPALLRDVTHTGEVAVLFWHHARALFGDAVPVLAGDGRAQRPLRPPAGAAGLARRSRDRLPDHGLRARSSGCWCSAARSPG